MGKHQHLCPVNKKGDGKGGRTGKLDGFGTGVGFA